MASPVMGEQVQPDRISMPATSRLASGVPNEREAVSVRDVSLDANALEMAERESRLCRCVAIRSSNVEECQAVQ